jgi:hypothetical protein
MGLPVHQRLIWSKYLCFLWSTLAFCDTSFAVARKDFVSGLSLIGMPMLASMLQGAPLYLSSVLARRLCGTSILSVCGGLAQVYATTHCAASLFPSPLHKSQFCVLVVVTPFWHVGCSQLHGLDVWCSYPSHGPLPVGC